MISLLIAVISWLGAMILGEILGTSIGAVLGRALRYVYAPPHGAFTLIGTWIATLALGYSLATTDGEHSGAAVLGFLALAGLGLVGVLTLRDTSRERKGLTQVQTLLPARLGGVGRFGLLLLGAGCLMLAMLEWNAERRRAWEAMGAAILFGSACLLGAATGRLPRWLVHVLGARIQPPKSIPPAG